MDTAASSSSLKSHSVYRPKSRCVHRLWQPEVARIRFLLVFSPCPVHADVCILLGLAGYGMAVAKQKLLARVILEVIVTTDVDHRRSLGLWRGVTLASMGKDFASEFQSLAEGILQEESAVGEVAVLGLRNDRFAGAPVQQPVSEILLQPHGNLVPNFSYAESLVVVTGRYFEHCKGADLGNVL